MCAHKNKKIVLESECKSNRVRNGKRHKKVEGWERLRERPLDKVSTLSVCGITMTPLCEERVCQGHWHHTREPLPILQQRAERTCDINDILLSRFLSLYARLSRFTRWVR